MRNAFAALACLALSCLPAAAAEKCLAKAEVLIANMAANIVAHPEYEIRIYDTDRARKIIDTINNDEPKTNFGGDRVLAMLKTDEDGAVIFFFLTGDCVTLAWPKVIPLKLWNDIVRRAIGEGV